MKKLYARYFVEESDTLSAKANLVYDNEATGRQRFNAMASVAIDVANWMEQHPKGTVDFVWSNV